MKKFQVNISFERIVCVVVEAEDEQAAHEAVAHGEYNDEDIVETVDNYVEIDSVVEIE